MPWKKRYHRLLKNDSESKRLMCEQMSLGDMLQADRYLPSLVRLVLKSLLSCNIRRAVMIIGISSFVISGVYLLKTS